MNEQGRPPLHRNDDPWSPPLESDREEFLKALHRHNPTVLIHLQADVQEIFASEGAGRKEDMWAKVCCSPRFSRLTGALENWARTSYLTWGGEPAEWVMEIALNTLNGWSEAPGARQKWHFPMHLHREYPSSDEGYVGASTGRSDQGTFDIHIEIAPWDRPGGESEHEFRQRFNENCRNVREGHVEEIKKQHWTTRLKLVRREYIEGLAIWQTKLSLQAVRQHLAAQGTYVGSDSELAAIMRGLDQTAGWIQVDRRRG